MKSLILEGFMGSGKSVIGRKLSASLGLPFVDTDHEIESRQGAAIADIFRECGEEAFRQMETSMLAGLVLSDTIAVISLGGGTPVRGANRDLIRSLGEVFYLKAGPDVLISRLKDEASGRPMLKGDDIGATVRSLLADREELYLGLADHVIDVSSADEDEICRRIKEAFIS